MAKNHPHLSEIEREIRRIEGQLLVAKQVCRENLEEINRLKNEQNPDPLLEQINRLLTIKNPTTMEHVQQFNHLLRQMVEERAPSDPLPEPILSHLATNVKDLESLFDYARTLCTEPLTSIPQLNHTNPLEEFVDVTLINSKKDSETAVDLEHLQSRITHLRHTLENLDQNDHCFIQ